MEIGHRRDHAHFVILNDDLSWTLYPWDQDTPANSRSWGYPGRFPDTGPQSPKDFPVDHASRRLTDSVYKAG